MAQTKPIFGRVQDVTKSGYYTGVETDTIDVNVNNDKREISANLRIDKILGVTSTTAFPGDRGQRAVEDLADEILRAKDAESELEKQINSNTKYVAEVEQQVQEIRVPTKVSELANDVSYAKQADVEDRFATKTYVQQKIAEAQVGGGSGDIDLSIYATIDYVDEKVANVEVDLTGYATEEYVQEKFNEIPKPDLSEYVTQTMLTHVLEDLKFIDGGNAPV